MPIRFKCSGCDQALKVPESMAGNKGKCPKCGAILRIPGGGDDEPEEPARPAPRKAKAPQRAIIEEKALRKRPPADEVVDDDDGEAPEEAVPRTRKGRKKKPKKRKKSSLLLIGLLGGGFALLLVCSGLGGLAWWYFFATGDDLVYMPNNCQMVVSLRVDQLLQSQALQELKREIPEFDGFQTNFDKQIGLSTSDIDYLVTGTGPNSKGGVLVVHTKKAVEASDIRSRIPKANYTETKVGKYVLYDPQNSISPAFRVLDKKRLVIGDKDAVREVLQRNKKPDFSKNMQEALKQMDFSKTLAFASDLQSAPSSFGDGLPMVGENKKMSDALKKINSVVVQATVSSDVRYEVALLCQDAAAANDIKTQVESSLNDLKKTLENLQAMQGNKQGMPKEVGDLLQLNLKVSGNKVTGGNSFKLSGLIQMYKQQKGKP